MEINKVLEAAIRILNQECKKPTIQYSDTYSDINAIFSAFAKGLGKPTPLLHKQCPNFQAMRGVHPREVWERTDVIKFGGQNFELILQLYSELGTEDQSSFITTILAFIGEKRSVCSAGRTAHFPNFAFKTSHTPLVAEFCFRTGHTRDLLDEIVVATFPSTGLVLLLMQMEETVALNFNIFSEDELRLITVKLRKLRQQFGKPSTLLVKERLSEAKQIVKSIDGILAECEDALFLYLKGYLQQTRNPEVEGDKVAVIRFLDTLGFPPDLKLSLEHAEKEYRDATTNFDLKNCFGHLRSFLEHLHRESAKALAATANDSAPDKWGAATMYLRQKGIFTTQHEAFVVSLYTLISDTSVHPLGADREYARLLRSVVIEYGLMFLTMLDKKGVKIN